MSGMGLNIRKFQTKAGTEIKVKKEKLRKRKNFHYTNMNK
jgi:hypothetical protein